MQILAGYVKINAYLAISQLLIFASREFFKIWLFISDQASKVVYLKFLQIFIAILPASLGSIWPKLWLKFKQNYLPISGCSKFINYAKHACSIER